MIFNSISYLSHWSGNQLNVGGQEMLRREKGNTTISVEFGD